jgi:hypothetical protein
LQHFRVIFSSDVHVPRWEVVGRYWSCLCTPQSPAKFALDAPLPSLSLNPEITADKTGRAGEPRKPWSLGIHIRSFRLSFKGIYRHMIIIRNLLHIERLLLYSMYKAGLYNRFTHPYLKSSIASIWPEAISVDLASCAIRSSS